MDNINKATESEVVDNAQIEQPESVEQSKEKLFSQKELDAIIEKRLAREQSKWEAKIKEEVNQAERLAQLSSEERKHEELKIQREQFDAQLKEFEEMKRQFERTQLLNETQKQLNERNLPIDVAEMLIGIDADSTKANIDKFEAKWSESLQKAVNDKLNNSSVSPRTPVRDEAGKHKDPKDMSLEEFAEYYKKK